MQNLVAKLSRAIDDQVVTGQPVAQVARVGALAMHDAFHVAIQFAQPGRRRGCLRPSDVRDPVQRLTVQVARLDHVVVGDADATDARCGKVLQHRYAEAACADDEHRGGAQPCLAFDPDLRQCLLPRIILRWRRIASVGVGRVLACVLIRRVFVVVIVLAGRVPVRVRRRARARELRHAVRDGVARRGSATLAVHPTEVAVGVVLFLPDRHAVLDLVDDVAARGEGLVAVRGTHAHPDGQLADREVADPVHAGRPQDAEAGRSPRPRCVHPRVIGERLESLVLEVPDTAARRCGRAPSLRSSRSRRRRDPRAAPRSALRVERSCR